MEILEVRRETWPPSWAGHFIALRLRPGIKTWHLLIRGVQPESIGSIIVHRRPPHVSFVLALERPSRRPMQDRPVIPDDQVPRVFPFHRSDELRLGDMTIQSHDQLIRLPPVQPLDMVQVRAHIKAHSLRRLMDLRQPVQAHRRLLNIKVFEELRARQLARVADGVAADQAAIHTSPQQQRARLLVQLVPRRARVCELGLAALAGRGHGDRPEERVRCPARVEAAVDVEQRVAPVVVRARAVGRDDLPFPVQIARVEELEVLVAELAPRRQVPPDVVQVAESFAEGDMRVVCKTGAAEYEEAVLRSSQRLCERCCLV